MAKKVKEYKINPDRVEEALLIQNRMLIELFVQVLDEQLVIERPVLHERLENLIELSNNDRDLKDTLHALTQKL
ncbi:MULTISPECIES: phosphate-starvation-inducible protein PsiE [Solibacillus]|uniref:phosphate-starvation-inducible protein PsiE n=1 Tax=Solibacillus TaxID=648800 RepID=UPI0009A562D8|nr:phosphate-starvation-inducible protein PsiE [Solibacillus isronensis]MCM3720814.1 phosphate-starvation-inducible protein PsiE [Solibacillus isronensis]